MTLVRGEGFGGGLHGLCGMVTARVLRWCGVKEKVAELLCAVGFVEKEVVVEPMAVVEVFCPSPGICCAAHIPNKAQVQPDVN